jgi:hypothetical protein
MHRDGVLLLLVFSARQHAAAAAATAAEPDAIRISYQLDR